MFAGINHVIIGTRAVPLFNEKLIITHVTFGTYSILLPVIPGNLVPERE